MAPPEWSAARLRDEIQALGARGLPRHEFFAELAPRLRRALDNDATCWHTIDPHTRLMTSDSPDELVERGVFAAGEVSEAGRLMVRSEYLVPDVNTFAALASRRVPVGILDHTLRGRPERSARYRDLLEPAGIPHELRAAFVVRGRTWGAVHVARRAGRDGFTARDAEVLAYVAGAIALGIRASLRFDAARRAGGEEPPGLILLGPDDSVLLMTPPARELLAEMDPRHAGRIDEVLPAPIAALVAHARGPAGPGADVNAVTVPGAGGWITLHASRPTAADGRVAVVVERAAARRSATLRLEVQGVTPREREVATLMARGLETAEIAEELVLSRHTVQDHVKSLYEKVGVGSRAELVASVFLDEYMPEVVRERPSPRADGSRAPERRSHPGATSAGAMAVTTAALR